MTIGFTTQNASACSVRSAHGAQPDTRHPQGIQLSHFWPARQINNADTSYATYIRAGRCRPHQRHWTHKPREMTNEQFKQEVEKELTGKAGRRWEIIYFKLYKSKIPVIEQAIETAALMLGTKESARLLSGDDLRGLSGGYEPWTTAIPTSCRAR